MNPNLKNILAVIAGWFIGSIVNMGLIAISGSVIPPPVGVDTNDLESIKAGMHLYEAKHFIFPFLAHALGTLVGAFVAAKLGTTRKMTLALVIGFVFMLGGIAMITMVPSPTWFMVLDLVVAYFPMAWLGGILANK